MWESSIVIIILAWYLTKCSLLKEISRLDEIENNYTLFLLVSLHILKLYYYILLISLLVIVFMNMVKIVFLEQVATASGGRYPFSIEKFLRDILRFYSDKKLLKFHLFMFLCINIVCYIAVIHIMKDVKNMNAVKSQLSLLFNSILMLVLILMVWLFRS